MELGLCGRNVFITASTSGIGKVVAEAFLKEGAKVILNGRNENKLVDVCKEFREKYGMEKVYGICGDVSEEAVICKVISRIKEYVSHIDILVGNLGTGKSISKDKFDLDEWRYMLKINLLSAVGLIQNVRDLFQNFGGSIVLMSSLAAHDRIEAPPAYAASKAGIVSLVKYAAPILIADHIRINAISPGNVFFEGGRWEEILSQNPTETQNYIENEVPMKRFGSAEEIAATVLFLSSERSSFTTGTIVQIDGGQSKGII